MHCSCVGTVPKPKTCAHPENANAMQLAQNHDTRKKQLERSIVNFEREYGACQEILEFHR